MISLVAQEETPNEQDLAIKTKISEFSKTSLEKFPKELESLSSEVDRYIGYKKKICAGEFSTLILDQKSDQEVTKKLAPQEKEICFRNLVTIQKEYLGVVFKKRKQFLEASHKKRIAELELIHEQALNNLNRPVKKRNKQR